MEDKMNMIQWQWYLVIGLGTASLMCFVGAACILLRQRYRQQRQQEAE
jgi:hypothetical protein